MCRVHVLKEVHVHYSVNGSTTPPPLYLMTIRAFGELLSLLKGLGFKIYPVHTPVLYYDEKVSVSYLVKATRDEQRFVLFHVEHRRMCRVGSAECGTVRLVVDHHVSLNVREHDLDNIGRHISETLPHAYDRYVRILDRVRKLLEACERAWRYLNYVEAEHVINIVETAKIDNIFILSLGTVREPISRKEAERLLARLRRISKSIKVQRGRRHISLTYIDEDGTELAQVIAEVDIVKCRPVRHVRIYPTQRAILKLLTQP